MRDIGSKNGARIPRPGILRSRRERALATRRGANARRGFRAPSGLCTSGCYCYRSPGSYAPPRVPGEEFVLEFRFGSPGDKVWWAGIPRLRRGAARPSVSEWSLKISARAQGSGWGCRARGPGSARLFAQRKKTCETTNSDPSAVGGGSERLLVPASRMIPRA